ncbi:MAG: Phosphoglycerate mutase [Ilumatobacteraceae bacterium]|nr:Phosphoglycerate mutase [Ilumatobacteraceae bacterium]
MTLLYLVRHGRASAGWNTDPDPGLDEIGGRQAVQVAARLAPLGPLAVVTSPLRRCQETSVPLLTAWACDARVEARVAEIPSPHGVGMADRVEWLRIAMAGTWGALGDRYTAYRDGVADALLACPDDTVVFSHFVAINAAIGAATDDDRLVIRSLDNCSVTIVEVLDGALHLRQAGHEADTLIR